MTVTTKPVIEIDQVWSLGSIQWVVCSFHRESGNVWLEGLGNGVKLGTTFEEMDRNYTYLGPRCKHEIQHDGKKIRCVHIEGHDGGIGATEHGTVPGVMEKLKEQPIEIGQVWRSVGGAHVTIEDVWPGSATYRMEGGRQFAISQSYVRQNWTLVKATTPKPSKMPEPPHVEVGQIWALPDHVQIHIMSIQGQNASVAYAPGDREFFHSIKFLRSHCKLVVETTSSELRVGQRWVNRVTNQRIKILTIARFPNVDSKDDRITVREWGTLGEHFELYRWVIEQDYRCDFDPPRRLVDGADINRPRPTPEDPLAPRQALPPLSDVWTGEIKRIHWGAEADWKKIHQPLEEIFPKVVVHAWAMRICSAGYHSLVRRITAPDPTNGARDAIWFTAPILWPVLQSISVDANPDEAIRILKAHRLLEEKPWYAKGTLPDFGFDE